MEYSELIAARYSVRAYRPDPVEDEKLQAVLEAARLAPTASNRQPFQLIVMHTAGREKEIGKIYRRPWFVQAPLVIGVCAISSLAWVRESDRFNARLIDAAIVTDHLILAATNLGLGTCWIAAFNVEAARSVLQLPDEAEPVIFTPLGYPADQHGPKIRKPLNELVRYEHWQGRREVMSDISVLAQQVALFLTPFVPYLIKDGIETAKSAAGKVGEQATENGWEKVQSMWSYLTKRGEVKNAAGTVLKLPDDADAQATLRMKIKLALSVDPSLVEIIERLLANATRKGTVTAKGSLFVAVGGSV